MNEQIRNEWKSLQQTPTKQLREIYARSHRVCSLSGVPKTDLVSGIMHARHGRRRIAEAFGLEK